jgi:threonine/homoserine/homoserine lactone efflux protein
MKRLALLAGVVFLLASLAGFAGVLVILPMYSAVLAAAGVTFLLYGATNRRALAPPHGDHDMRDLGGF